MTTEAKRLAGAEPLRHHRAGHDESVRQAGRNAAHRGRPISDATLTTNGAVWGSRDRDLWREGWREAAEASIARGVPLARAA